MPTAPAGPPAAWPVSVGGPPPWGFRRPVIAGAAAPQPAVLFERAGQCRLPGWVLAGLPNSAPTRLSVPQGGLPIVPVVSGHPAAGARRRWRRLSSRMPVSGRRGEKISPKARTALLGLADLGFAVPGGRQPEIQHSSPVPLPPRLAAHSGSKAAGSRGSGCGSTAAASGSPPCRSGVGSAGSLGGLPGRLFRPGLRSRRTGYGFVACRLRPGR